MTSNAFTIPRRQEVRPGLIVDDRRMPYVGAFRVGGNACKPKVLAYLEQQDQQVSPKQIAMAIGSTEDSARTALKALETEGRVHIAAIRSNTRYWALGASAGGPPPVQQRAPKPVLKRPHLTSKERTADDYAPVILDPAVLDEMTVKLMSENPDWSPVRCRHRAKVLWLKGGRP